MPYMTIEEAILKAAQFNSLPLRINKLTGNNDNFLEEIIAIGQLPTPESVGSSYLVVTSDLHFFKTSVVKEVVINSESSVIIKTMNSIYQVDLIC